MRSKCDLNLQEGAPESPRGASYSLIRVCVVAPKGMVLSGFGLQYTRLATDRYCAKDVFRHQMTKNKKNRILTILVYNGEFFRTGFIKGILLTRDYYFRINMLLKMEAISV